MLLTRIACINESFELAGRHARMTRAQVTHSEKVALSCGSKQDIFALNVHNWNIKFSVMF